MASQKVLYLLPFLASLAVSTGVGLFACRRRSVVGARAFAVYAFVNAGMTLGYILELIAATLKNKLFWDDVQFIGTFAAPILYLVFVFQYTDRRLNHPERWLYALMVVPVLSSILIFTDPLHGLVRAETRLITYPGFDALDYAFTPVFYMMVGYPAILGLLGLLLMVDEALQTQAPYHRQSLILMVGIIIPYIAAVLPLFGLRLTPFRDVTPLGFGIGNLILALGLFRYNLFDLVPVARDTIIEQMADGIIVIDAQGRIVDVNPPILNYMQQPKSQIVGRRTEDVFPEWRDLIHQVRREERFKDNINVEQDDQQWHYEVIATTLYDRYQQPSGRIVIFRDVTLWSEAQTLLQTSRDKLEMRVRERTADLIRANTQLQALSRRLVNLQEDERATIARELHDEAGQALSYQLLMLSMLERDADDAEAVQARADEIAATTEALMENLRRLARRLHPSALDHLGLASALNQHVNSVAEQTDIAINVETVGLEGVRLPPEVEIAIYRVVQEGLTNVLRHAQATRADVLVERRDDHVVALVEDNGVGFNPDAVPAADHLGLVGMRERALALGGALTLESDPDRGTTLHMEIPYEEPSG
jgi:PAS domain S-box-containing protein